MRHPVVLGAACFLLLTLAVPAAGQGSDSSWTKTYGGTDGDEAWSVIQTSDGGYALAGSTRSHGAGLSDFWLMKTDPSGNEEWSRTFGGDGDDHVYSVVQTSDGGYVLAGDTNSSGVGWRDFWLVKTNSSGNEDWNRTFGGTGSDRAYSVVQTSDGGYILAGYTDSYGAGGWDMWLVKTDPSGNEEWSKTFGGEYDDHAYSVVQTSDGGYALVGSTISYSIGGLDILLVKTGSSGNEEWIRTFGGENDDGARSIVQTSDGGYAIAGHTRSYGAEGEDFWLLKTDPLGNEEWSKTFGGEYDDHAYSVVQTSDGGYALVGHTGSYGAGGYDFLLVKTDPSGSEEWSTTFGGADDDHAYSVVQTPDGGYTLAGYTKSYGAGGEDFWLVRMEFPTSLIFYVVAGAIAVVGVVLVLILYKKSKG